MKQVNLPGLCLLSALLLCHVVAENNTLEETTLLVEATNTSAEVILTSAQTNASTTTDESTTVGQNQTEGASISIDTTTTAPPDVIQTTESNNSTSASPPAEETNTSFPAQLCRVSVENITTDSVCHPSNHKILTLDRESETDPLIPTNDWYLLIDRSTDECLSIPVYVEHKCPQKGSCGSNHPYYLLNDHLPEENSSDNVTLCTTDALSSGRQRCCQEQIIVSVQNCQDKFSVYKFLSPMNSAAPGRLCAESPEVFSLDFVINDTLSVVSQLHSTIGLEILSEQQQQELITVILLVEDKAQFKTMWQEAILEFIKTIEKAVLQALNNGSARTRRDASVDSVAVDLLEGYPKLNLETNEVTLVLFAHTGDNKPIAKEITEIEVKQLIGQDPGIHGSGSKVSKVSVQEVTSTPNLTSDKTTVVPHGAGTEGSRLWIAILIIIGFTAFIVAAAFLFVGCYSWSKGKHSGSFDMAHKEALVSEETDDSYRPVSGHDNMAMQADAVDTNQNAAKDLFDKQEEDSM